MICPHCGCEYGAYYGVYKEPLRWICRDCQQRTEIPDTGKGSGRVFNEETWVLEDKGSTPEQQQHNTHTTDLQPPINNGSTDGH